MRPDRPSRRAAVGLLVTLIVAGCTGGSLADAEQRPPAPAPAAAPPAPPASCLLDVGTLGADTGLMWTPDDATASDRRCIYSPSGDAGLAFVGVDVAPSAGDAATAKLDALAEVCDDRTRTPVRAGEGAFVCRFQGGSVFGAVAAGGRVVTVAASAVPAGTTAERLTVAFTGQLIRIAGRLR